MRIEQGRSIRPAASRRDDKKVGSGARFADALETDATSTTAAAQPLTGIEGLFALQEVPDATAERRRGIARGQLLLDRLDDIRVGLLAGIIPRDKLADLAGLARSARVAVDDPALAAVLDEIELRAAVELAKLS